MKKLFFTAAVGLLCTLISCKNESSSTDNKSNSGDKAKANNREVLKCIENGDASKLDSFITKDAVDHSGGANGMMEIKGLDSIKKSLGGMKQDFSEIKFDIVEEATSTDHLFVIGKMTGTTSANPGNGMPPNQKIEMTSVDVIKFNSEGMLTEHWSFNDPKDMMKMMGGDHKMDMKKDEKMDHSKMDTTKK